MQVAEKSKIITNLAIVLVTFVAITSLIELCSTAIIKKLPVYQTRWAFRENNPPAYANSPYYNADFIRESAQSVTIEYDGKVSRLKDFKGKYINVVNGLRRTKFTPEEARNTVHIYGASTIFSQEVPDEFTIPSILQRKVKEITDRYMVVNHGVPAVDSGDQLYYLHETKLKQGDIVIFFGGGGDIYNNVYAGNGHDASAKSPGIKKTENFFETQILPAIEKVKLINLAKLLKYIERKSIPVNMRNAEEVNARATEASENFANNIQQANQYSRMSGADFYNFFQPSVFSLKKRTEHEQFIIDNFFLTPSGVELAYNNSIDKFLICNKTLNSEGIVSIDLSHVLDNRQGEVYLDFAHSTERANETIASAIFSMISWKL